MKTLGKIPGQKYTGNLNDECGLRTKLLKQFRRESSGDVLPAELSRTELATAIHQGSRIRMVHGPYFPVSLKPLEREL